MSLSIKSLFEKLYNLIYRVKLTDKLFFAQNLTLMIKSGVPLARGLSILAKQTENKKFKKIITDIGHRVEKGQLLSKSLEMHPQIFSAIFINMVKAGEESGRLDEILKELTLQMRKEHELLSKVKGALIYPIVVVAAMVSIVSGMMIFVIPKLTAMFTEAGVELPLPTKILIIASNFLSRQLILVLIVLAAAVILFLKFKKTTAGKQILHKFILRSPILGTIALKINLARFARNLASLLKTDIPIVVSFEITATLLSNVYYKNALKIGAQKIVKGETIGASLADYNKLFPPVISQMILIGEETGKLDEVLADLANFYEEDLDNIFKNLPSIIEPILLICLGVIVGGIAIAIMMPIYSLSRTAG